MDRGGERPWTREGWQRGCRSTIREGWTSSGGHIDKALRFAGGFILTAVAVTAVARYWWVILAVVVIAIVAFVASLHLCVWQGRRMQRTVAGRAELDMNRETFRQRRIAHAQRHVPQLDLRTTAPTVARRDIAGHDRLCVWTPCCVKRLNVQPGRASCGCRRSSA